MSSQHVPTGAEQRARNRAVILGRLRDAARDGGAGLTLAQLCRATGLSRPTVEAVLQASPDHATPVKSVTTAGRPARAWRFTPGPSLAVGVDLGPHRVAGMVCDLAGRVVGHQERHLSRPDAAAGELADLMTAMRGRDADFGRPTARSVESVVVSIPAHVDGGGRFSECVPLPGLPLDLATDLSTRIGAPVRLDNDVAMALLGEVTAGAAQGHASVALVQVGHRTGAAVMVEHRLLRGRHGVAGNIGYLPEVGWTDVWPAQGFPTVRESLVAAAAGDEVAVQWFDHNVDVLARGIATLVMAVDPDLVVVSGGVSEAGEQLLGPLSRAVSARLPTSVDTPLLAAHLGADAALVGATIRALHALTRAVLGTDAGRPALDLAGCHHRRPA